MVTARIATFWTGRKIVLVLYGKTNIFFVFAPWASVHPFEFWMFSKRHQPTLLDISPSGTKSLAKALRVCFGGLRSLLNDPPYNFGFHIAPSGGSHDYYHWHLEVFPKLAIWAGFEKSTGIFINVMPPEEAAKSLRKAVQLEETKLLRGANY